jgi:glycerate kinase
MRAGGACKDAHMRVVVATDAIGGLSSARAGAVLASGWPAAGVTVLPAGEAGGGFAQAVADSWGVELDSGVLEGGLLSWAQSRDEVVIAAPTAAEPADASIPLTESSHHLGAAIRYVLTQRGRPVSRILLDCAGVDTHDGGAGLLSGLEATADRPLDQGVAALSGLGEIRLGPVRDLLAGAELVGVVPANQLAQPLLGLRGITSLRGRASGLDPERLLGTDATLEQFARVVGAPAAGLAGAGACGGVGFAVLALGGRLSTGPAVAFELAAVPAAVRAADLVVTGCSVFDFASRGGGVVAEAARVAAEALCPCIAVAGEVLIGGREMRTMGIESAYPVRESSMDRPVGGDVTADELAAVVARVARSWQW